MNKKELWLEIVNYQFENLVPTHLWDHIAAQFGGQNAFVKAFADKISRKLNWRNKFALKAISEYKKFIFLGVISNQRVTPSKVIDQVWHEHLLFSSGYRRFCNDIIRYNFDHNPELISVDSQTQLFRSQYYHTIELYKKEFGHEPPSDIWGSVKFKEDDLLIEMPKTDSNKSDYSNSFWEVDSLCNLLSSAERDEFKFGGGESGGGGAGGNWVDNSDSNQENEIDDGDDSCSSCSSSCGD